MSNKAPIINLSINQINSQPVVDPPLADNVQIFENLNIGAWLLSVI